MFSTPFTITLTLTLTLLLLVLFCTSSVSAKQSTSASTSMTKNHEMLTKVGMKRVRPPNSHHRKRLAVESRHHGRTDDSHMFVIKLPPNQHYYAHTKPVEHVKNAIGGGHDGGGRMPKVPVGFQGNGKPGKIYHWNIPVMKQIAKAKSKSRRSDSRDSPVIDVKYNGWNDVLDKEPAILGGGTYKKPSFYVPAKPKKSSFFKYFPGNGKPKSFYVIEKNRKKAHHHRLLQ